MVHELQGALVVGLNEAIVCGEGVEGPPVYPDEDEGVGKEGVGQLEVPDVFVSE